MATISISLLVFCVGCLLSAYWFAQKFARSSIWHWADPLYYPLAILGVFLLFISGENTREVQTLHAKYAAIEQLVRDHETTKPSGNVANIAAPLLKSSYDLLMSQVELGKACERSPSRTGRCASAPGHEAAISAAFRDFQPILSPANDTTTAGRMQDYCRRGYKLFDALEEKGGFTRTVASELKDSFAVLARGKLGPTDFAVTSRAEKEFESKLASDWSMYLNLIKPNDRPQMQEIWESSVSFASVLFSAFALCVRIPESVVQQLATIQRWTEEKTRRESEKSEVEARIQEAEAGRTPSFVQQVVGFILANLWPFVLVAALALKFAKGIVSLPNKRRVG